MYPTDRMPARSPSVSPPSPVSFLERQPTARVVFCGDDDRVPVNEPAPTCPRSLFSSGISTGSAYHNRGRQTPPTIPTPPAKKARRCLGAGLVEALDSGASDDDSIEATQEIDYSQVSDVVDIPPDDKKSVPVFVLEPEGTNSPPLLIESDLTIGRDKENDWVVSNPYVSAWHCRLDLTIDGGLELLVVSKKGCFIERNGKWESVGENSRVAIEPLQRFRLIPGGGGGALENGVQFKVHAQELWCGVREADESKVPPGPASFDLQYLDLLRSIDASGVHQENKKGPNRTLPELAILEVDGDEMLLPVTTLRSMWGCRNAITEAMWYLRGESNIDFLKRNKCPFWDEQADEGGFIGLNYGLLTKFPQADGTFINQLEENVLAKLCRGKTSRNMLVTLAKPGEPTNQEACTSSLQFAVSKGTDDQERLNLTIHQRSSDVVLGLPHDVVVWSVIYHLVRRDVFKRSKRRLAAGTIFFVISAGGAHVYDMNEKPFWELLRRVPKSGNRPELTIEDGVEDGIFLLAKKFDRNKAVLKVRGYTNHHPGTRIKQAA